MATTLAERMSKFSGSPTSALIAKVAELKQQGKDIISLNVGEPDFGTPDYIKVAGMKAIADNFTKYTPGNGILELRQEIVKKLKQDNGIEYGLNEITTSVGAKQAIASAMMVIAGPGDEVILPIPCWVSYTEMIRLAGATPVFVPVRPDNYELDLKAIEDAITPRTKAIIICTPNNPTGAVYSEESLRKLAELAVKHDFFIVADEIYEKLVYDGAKHFSVASISQEVKERTVTVNGFSKAYAMTGWRIGYAAARPDVIKGIMAVQSQTTSATSSISQKAAAAALRGPQHDMEVMVEEFKRRKDYVVKRLNGIPGIVCPDVKGAFYVYPDVQAYLGKSFGDRRIETAVDLCQYLLDEALVSTVPGEAYNVPGKIRISYSNSMENLEKALDRVEKALEALHYGELCPQQEKALEELGIPLPNPEKPKGRNNNRKQTFDAVCRTILFDIARRHGLHLDQEPSYGGRDYLEKQDYILMKQKEQLAAQEQKLEELTLKIEDVETLLDDVSDAAYDKAVEVVTDTVRQEAHKEDIRLVEETKKWVLSPERKAPKKEREYAAERLDGVITKIKNAMQHALAKIQRTLMQPEVKQAGKEQVKKKAKESIMDMLAKAKINADRDNRERWEREGRIAPNKKNDMEL